MDSPRFKHHTKNHVFLGRWNQFDLYCDIKNKSVICRDDNKKQDYSEACEKLPDKNLLSEIRNMKLLKHVEALRIAYLISQDLGYIDLPTKKGITPEGFKALKKLEEERLMKEMLAFPWDFPQKRFRDDRNTFRFKIPNAISCNDKLKAKVLNHVITWCKEADVSVDFFNEGLRSGRYPNQIKDIEIRFNYRFSDKFFKEIYKYIEDVERLHTWLEKVEDDKRTS